MNRSRLLTLFCAALAAALLYGFAKPAPAAQPAPQAQPTAGPVGRFTTVSAVYKFEGNPELTTLVRLDTMTGAAWFLRVNKSGAGAPVEWAPIPNAQR